MGFGEAADELEFEFEFEFETGLGLGLDWGACDWRRRAELAGPDEDDPKTLPWPLNLPEDEDEKGFLMNSLNLSPILMLIRQGVQTDRRRDAKSRGLIYEAEPENKIRVIRGFLDQENRGLMK